MSLTTLQHGDALVIVDMQNDFVTGALAVPQGSEVVGPLNRAIDAFVERGLPVVATRDWHPPDHCSFQAQGGPWPPHCVAGTAGADYVPDLRLPGDAFHVLKATMPQADAYSGFQGTDLASDLHARSVRRLIVGGLATDYCVLNTVRDGIDLGFEVLVLNDAVRAVNVHPGNGAKAETEMQHHGAQLTSVDAILAAV
jgi:nicotinamidase/pyrazinamidase